LYVPVIVCFSSYTQQQQQQHINMNSKLMMLLLVGVACVSAMTVENVQEKFSHVQEIDDDDGKVEGTYKWEDDVGNTHFVSYVADEDGYRVVDSDVVPATGAGVRADGNQGASNSGEDNSVESPERF